MPGRTIAAPQSANGSDPGLARSWPERTDFSKKRLAGNGVHLTPSRLHPIASLVELVDVCVKFHAARRTHAWLAWSSTWRVMAAEVSRMLS